MIVPLEVTKAEYLAGYRLLVWFNDNAVKIVDLAGYLHKPHLAPLKEDDRIRRFQVDLQLRGFGVEPSTASGL